MDYDKTMVQVASHTNSTGAERDNPLLSRKRARRMAARLTGFGVNSVRIDPVGFGETRPFASNATQAGRARNRRMEVTLLPYTQD